MDGSCAALERLFWLALDEQAAVYCLGLTHQHWHPAPLSLRRAARAGWCLPTLRRLAHRSGAETAPGAPFRCVCAWPSGRSTRSVAPAAPHRTSTPPTWCPAARQPQQVHCRLGRRETRRARARECLFATGPKSTSSLGDVYTSLKCGVKAVLARLTTAISGRKDTLPAFPRGVYSPVLSCVAR